MVPLLKSLTFCAEGLRKKRSPMRFYLITPCTGARTSSSVDSATNCTVQHQNRFAEVKNSKSQYHHNSFYKEWFSFLLVRQQAASNAESEVGAKALIVSVLRKTGRDFAFL